MEGGGGGGGAQAFDMALKLPYFANRNNYILALSWDMFISSSVI